MVVKPGHGPDGGRIPMRPGTSCDTHLASLSPPIPKSRSVVVWCVRQRGFGGLNSPDDNRLVAYVTIQFPPVFSPFWDPPPHNICCYVRRCGFAHEILGCGFGKDGQQWIIFISIRSRFNVVVLHYLNINCSGRGKLFFRTFAWQLTQVIFSSINRPQMDIWAEEKSLQFKFVIYSRVFGQNFRTFFFFLSAFFAWLIVWTGLAVGTWTMRLPFED